MAEIESTLQMLATRVRDHAETIATEEAAKTAVVLPLLQTLGYDVFNPAEVIPEFTADAVGKKGEKVDYAVKLNNEIAILVECKGLNTKLDKVHLSQLYRYFSVTNAKFAILTNCRYFEFYTDLESPNRLDTRPFFRFDILDLHSNAVTELQKFAKNAFDVTSILATAERLKYVSAIKQLLKQQLDEPSDELIKLISSTVHEGRLTAQVRTLLGSATRSAFRELVRDEVQSRLSSALKNSSTVEIDDFGEVEGNVSEIETTPEEIEGTLTIKAIVRGTISADRVGLRDSKSYCAVLVDDNNRKPLARLHFNRTRKYIGLFDGVSEERVSVETLDDIYQYADRLIETAKRYQ